MMIMAEGGVFLSSKTAMGGMETGMIAKNLKLVQEQIASALERTGRDGQDTALIAVSKTKPVSMILEAYEQGIRDFGENKVQELTDKYGQLPKDIRWHMIGHLQRNKVKYLIGKAVLIHSVDSLRLAQEIDREARRQNMPMDILIEVNVAGEESKFGVSPQETAALVADIAKLPFVHIRGLMTIAPDTRNPEENRKYFRCLKQLAVDITRKNIDNVSMHVLSMGMTNDYVVAVEEGSSYVRVGTGIFGGRNLSV